MTRRMSVSMTQHAVEAEIKDVTRRHRDTWKNLRAGDHLLLIEKGMGLPKGAKQVTLKEVLVVGVRLEPLGRVTFAEVQREGLLERALQELSRLVRASTGNVVDWFVRFWADGHGYRKLDLDEARQIEVRRIEWRYL